MLAHTSLFLMQPSIGTAAIAAFSEVRRLHVVCNVSGQHAARRWYMSSTERKTSRTPTSFPATTCIRKSTLQPTRMNSDSDAAVSDEVDDSWVDLENNKDQNKSTGAPMPFQLSRYTCRPYQFSKPQHPVNDSRSKTSRIMVEKIPEADPAGKNSHSEEPVSRMKKMYKQPLQQPKQHVCSDAAIRAENVLKNMERLVYQIESVAKASARSKRANLFSKKRASLEEIHFRQFATIAQAMTRRHYERATNVQLVRLIKACLSIPRSPAACRVVLNTTEVLLRKLAATDLPNMRTSDEILTPDQISLILGLLLKVQHAAAEERVLQVVEKCLLTLRSKQVLLQMSPQQVYHLVGNLYGHNRRLSTGIVRDLLALLIPLLTEDRKDILSPQIVAATLGAIRRFEFLNQDCKFFFDMGAKACLANVKSMSGRDVARTLDAFAAVGYVHAELFIALGQQAGDIGEDLHPNQAAMIIAALDRQPIDSSDLRASLQSSLRFRAMKNRGL